MELLIVRKENRSTLIRLRWICDVGLALQSSRQQRPDLCLKDSFFSIWEEAVPFYYDHIQYTTATWIRTFSSQSGQKLTDDTQRHALTH